MLLKCVLLVLVLWLFGMLGPYDIATLVRLLVVLVLIRLLLGALPGRETAKRREGESRPEKR